MEATCVPGEGGDEEEGEGAGADGHLAQREPPGGEGGEEERGGGDALAVGDEDDGAHAEPVGRLERHVHQRVEELHQHHGHARLVPLRPRPPAAARHRARDPPASERVTREGLRLTLGSPQLSRSIHVRPRSRTSQVLRANFYDPDFAVKLKPVDGIKNGTITFEPLVVSHPCVLPLNSKNPPRG